MKRSWLLPETRLSKVNLSALSQSQGREEAPVTGRDGWGERPLASGEIAGAWLKIGFSSELLCRELLDFTHGLTGSVAMAPSGANVRFLRFVDYGSPLLNSPLVRSAS